MTETQPTTRPPIPHPRGGGPSALHPSRWTVEVGLRVTATLIALGVLLGVVAAGLIVGYVNATNGRIAHLEQVLDDRTVERRAQAEEQRRATCALLTAVNNETVVARVKAQLGCL